MKAAIIDKGRTLLPERGTPQGGVISPMLANLALNGLESVVKDKRITGMHLVRYADDFIVSARNKEELAEVIIAIKKFLKIRGLKINERKSGIRHITEGFSFLG